MRKIIQKIAQAVLMAPIKLPSKAMNVLKYLAVALGIIEQVMQDDSDDTPDAASEWLDVEQEPEAPKAIGKEGSGESAD